MAGFAGVLVGLANTDCCGIFISGLTSTGKTTAQKLAVSAWSRPKADDGSLLQSARTTTNAAEVLAANANGTVLALDEAAHMGGKEMGRLIYSIAGGRGKARLNSDADIKGSRGWSTFALLSGETSLSEKIRSDGETWTPGMAVRFCDIDVTGANNQVSATALAAIAEIDNHYGHAG